VGARERSKLHSIRCSGVKIQRSSVAASSAGANREWPYDVAVAYRIYPKVTPPARCLPCGDDKLRQAEICLRSFRDSLGTVRAKIWAVLDGCPGNYRRLFERYFKREDLVFIDVNGIGNRATYDKQVEILLSQQAAEYVYFAEDDYFYLPGQFRLMIEFLREQRNFGFVTPYDHPDCYRVDLHREPKWISLFAGRHWRTAASTCLTFLTHRATLGRYERTLRSFSRGNDDCAMWLSVTKRKVLNPFAPIRYFARQRSHRTALAKAWRFGRSQLVRSHGKDLKPSSGVDSSSPRPALPEDLDWVALTQLGRAWFFCWQQIVFGTPAKLWVPIPGIATHLSPGLMSPGTDWVALMNAEAQSVGDLEPIESVDMAELRSHDRWLGDK
jgi:hypothetical protein